MYRGPVRVRSLGSPITLQASTSYYLVTQESTGGDSWYDSGAVATDHRRRSEQRDLFLMKADWYPLRAPTRPMCRRISSTHGGMRATVPLTHQGSPAGVSSSIDGARPATEQGFILDIGS